MRIVLRISKIIEDIFIILYMRTILRIYEIKRGRTILFSKGCPSPLFAPLCVVVVTAHIQAVGLAAGEPLAPAPLLAHRGQLPLAGWPPLEAWPRASAPCGLAATGRARGRLLPLRTVARCRGPGRNRSLLCKGALAVVGRPLAGRSYILVFQIRMEKMKEVKRPPL
ncbi:hypothetical protein GW17_00039363 [Ensete ventricosum]|nr:hypothetical protein GW17_00039363 [Ensete ventricosum]